MSISERIQIFKQLLTFLIDVIPTVIELFKTVINALSEVNNG